MPQRLCLLLLGMLALMGLTPLPAAQSPERAAIHPKWEYKVLKLEARQCQFEEQVVSALNFAGEEGWELMSYERLSIAFPKDAEGTLLIRPAATGPGREHTPQTADSFQGSIKMKMTEVQPGACRLLLKRQAFAATKP